MESLLTSVVVPMSAEGLQVLASGGAVLTLLRTGDPGIGPKEGSGYMGACRKMPFFCIFSHALVILYASSYSNCTC